MTDFLARLRKLYAKASPTPWSEDDGNLHSEPLGDERDDFLSADRADGDLDQHFTEHGDPKHWICTTQQRAWKGDENLALIQTVVNAGSAMADAIEAADELLEAIDKTMVGHRARHGRTALERAIVRYREARGRIRRFNVEDHK